MLCCARLCVGQCLARAWQWGGEGGSHVCSNPIFCGNDANYNQARARVTTLHHTVTRSRGLSRRWWHSCRWQQATHQFESFGYHPDNFHLGVDIVTLSPVFVFPSCYAAVVRVRYVGRASPLTSAPGTTILGSTAITGTQTIQTLSPPLETQRNSPHAKGSMLSMSGRRRLGAGVICRAS